MKVLTCITILDTQWSDHCQKCLALTLIQTGTIDFHSEQSSVQHVQIKQIARVKAECVRTYSSGAIQPTDCSLCRDRHRYRFGVWLGLQVWMDWGFIPSAFFSKLTYPIVFFITNTKHSWLRFCFIVSKYPTDLRITILWGTRELASETQTHTWHRTNTRHQILAWNRRVIIYICTRSKRENQRDLFEA